MDVFKIQLHNEIVGKWPRFKVFDEEIPEDVLRKNNFTPCVVLKEFELTPAEIGGRSSNQSRQYTANLDIVAELHMKRGVIVKNQVNLGGQDPNAIRYWIRHNTYSSLLQNILLEVADFENLCGIQDRQWLGTRTFAEENRTVYEIRVRYRLKLDLSQGLNSDYLYDNIDRFDMNIEDL